MNSRERVLAHLEGREIDRLPVMPITMQFAADLIGAKYCDYERDYRVLAEGQMRVAEKFGFDYVNTMSDPAREAADCGAAVEYFEDTPAALLEEKALLADKTVLSRLEMPHPLSAPRMLNGIKSVAFLKQQVGKEKIVEGWVEGPCAEGADLRGINTLMLDFYDDPQFVRDLFNWVVEMELRFGQEQIRAGADLIGIGDAAASLVGPDIYDEFVWPYQKRLVDGLKGMGAKVRLHICGNIKFGLSRIARLGLEIVDIDSLVPLSEARALLGDDQMLLGNLNPVTGLRQSSPHAVLAGLVRCHTEAGARMILGAGCEIPRDTPPENVQAFAEYSSFALV